MLIFATMNTTYFSIRMHASRDCRHLSGAERLVPKEEVDSVSLELISRAMNSSPGAVNLNIDEIQTEEIVFGSIPNLTLMPWAEYRQGRAQAVSVLVEAGVSESSALAAVATIAAGAASDGFSMRGAMLIDAVTGERLEPDRERGVRASHLDITQDASATLLEMLRDNGLLHIRTREALVLAAKVMTAPGVIAELCWSDAADYTAGYVASAKTGYLRFPALKNTGDPRGGRAFFVQSGADLVATTEYLEKTPFLVNRHGGIFTRKDAG